MKAGLDRGLILAAQVIAQEAQGNAPVDTGRLSRSITSGEPYTAGKYRRIRVGTNVEYAWIQEFGGTIPPRFVEPQTKQALHWTKDGKDYFSKGHTIPAGTIPAQPYLIPAFKANRQKANQIILRSVVAAAHS
jgi:HK97 gp10 family phage protein